MEIQSNLRSKKLHRTDQSSNFLGGSLNNRDNVRAQSSLEEKVNLSILKGDFPSRTDSSIFTSIEPLLLDWSNKTKGGMELTKNLKKRWMENLLNDRGHPKKRGFCRKGGMLLNWVFF